MPTVRRTPFWSEARTIRDDLVYRLSKACKTEGMILRQPEKVGKCALYIVVLSSRAVHFQEMIIARGMEIHYDLFTPPLSDEVRNATLSSVQAKVARPRMRQQPHTVIYRRADHDWLANTCSVAQSHSVQTMHYCTTHAQHGHNASTLQRWGVGPVRQGSAG